MVLYRDNIDNVQSKELNVAGIGKKSSGKIVRKYSAGKKKTLLRVKLTAGQKVEKVLAENWSQKDPRILRVEPNYRVYALGIPNDVYFSYQWALHNTGQTYGVSDGDIDAPEAWNLTTGSSGVVVAVIDSGVSYMHPDLTNQIWTNSDEIPGNGIDDDGNGYIDDCYGYDFAQNDNDPNDENGHGTHCAGIIAAQGNNGIGVSGVNWHCQIMPCRFLDASGSGSIADAIEAINYAVANGANVLSNSWGGGGYSEALKTAIENAKAHNVLFVAAAGNSAVNNDISPTYPCSYSVSNIISVAATDHQDTLAYFSNYGKQSVHISAPGVNILSTLPGGYGWCSGTSMATPYVSGVAALLLSVNPGMTAAELKNRIIWSGDALPGLENKTITGRRLNVYKTLTVNAALEVLEPQSDSNWVVGFNYQIQWMSIGGDTTVDLYLEKGGQIIKIIAQNVSNEGSYTWRIPTDLTNGSDYTVRIEDGQQVVRSQAFSVAEEGQDYYTELFSSTHPFDLAGKSVLFVPQQGETYYALTQDISGLPTSPAGGKKLKLHDDDSVRVILSRPVIFGGAACTSIFVGSNGYITFDQPDTEYRANLVNHFSKKRISACFVDLNPDAGGQITVREITDRVAITWENIPKFNGTAAYTFQVEMYYNGKIRLSWLDVRSGNEVAGLSQGDGVANDYLDSDMSDYNTYDPELLSIKISGSQRIAENTPFQLTCTGYYDDGIIRDISEDQDISWSAVPSTASISASGTLYVGEVDIFEHVNIIAEAGGLESRFGVYVKGEEVSDIHVSKCTVAAGKTEGQDCLSISGNLSLTETTLGQSEWVRVKLYSSDNICLFESSYDSTAGNIKNGTCSFKKNSGSQKEMLRINCRNHLFQLSVRNASFKGLSSPFYITLECGTYTGAGQIIVKGKSKIPMSLMDSVKNTLRIDAVQRTAGNAASSTAVSVKGGFSLHTKISNPGDIILTWNTKTFTFPVSQASEKNKVFVYRNIPTELGILSGKFDLQKNIFTFQVKNTDLSSDERHIHVGLSFGAFDEFQIAEL